MEVGKVAAGEVIDCTMDIYMIDRGEIEFLEIRDEMF